MFRTRTKMPLPTCAASDGFLRVIQLMAEWGVRKVLVTDNEAKSVVGMFQLEPDGVRYLPAPETR